jgi:hypothetical protein
VMGPSPTLSPSTQLLHPSSSSSSISISASWFPRAPAWGGQADSRAAGAYGTPDGEWRPWCWRRRSGWSGAPIRNLRT